MKKVYLEKRGGEHFEEMSDYRVMMNDTEFQSLNAVMEEDLGLEDLDTLIQLELDNYTSCFSDMLNIHNENSDLQRNFILENESPTHNHSYEYVIQEPIIENPLRQPITTSGIIKRP